MLWDVEVQVVTLKCNECGKIFYHRMYLSLEELLVEQSKPHFCDKCTKEE